MGDFVYTTVPGKIKPLLTKIRDVGIPTKVGSEWLKVIGYTSSNDRSLIGVLKTVGFIDSSQIPTPLWQAYRGSNGPSVLAQGIKLGYAELYSVYPDAHVRSSTELEHVFSTSSKAAKQTISKIVSTFKGLVAEAEFSTGEDHLPDEVHVDTGPLIQPATNQPTLPVPRTGAGPALHIDMQIHISADSNAEQIDQIFASMAKHLYGVK